MRHIFTATGAGIAYEWDLETGKCVKSFGGSGSHRHMDYLHGVAYVATSNEVLTASEDGTIRLWGKLAKMNHISGFNIIES